MTVCMVSETLVYLSLFQARTGRTTLVIAHRLSTIRTADIIVGLKDGVVEEQGTHDELMSKGGIYYTLCTNQVNTRQFPVTHCYINGYSDVVYSDVRVCIL